MNIITSVTVFNDAVGMRMSATYSVVDDAGRIIKDNQRFDRVVTNSSIKADVANLFEYAAESIPE